MNDSYQFTVSESEASGRLDAWLSGRIEDLSRSRIQSLIKSGFVLIDGQSMSPHHKVKAGMDIQVDIPPAREIELEPQDIPLDVLWEDGDVIVVNKPAGLVVHPAAGHSDGTLVNALLFACSDLQGIGGEIRPGIVHRLDKDTSGVMVAAKSEASLENLQAQFRERSVSKEYVAVVHGVPSPSEGEIRTMIGRSSHDRKKMTAKPKSGREAVTSYSLLSSSPDEKASVVTLKIATGRTHQIRVHMAHIGHPVAGDKQYGNSRKDALLPVQAPRQMLHARCLSFLHPSSGERMEFTAPVPPDMEKLISAL